MREPIARLEIGRSVTDGLITVKRHARHVYSLALATNRYRNRWGTLAEILEDYDHTASTGQLPQPAGKSWF